MKTPIKTAILDALAKCEADLASGTDVTYRSFAYRPLGMAYGRNVAAVAGIEATASGKRDIFVNVEASDLVDNAYPKTDDAGVFDACEFGIDQWGNVDDAGVLLASHLKQELALLSGVGKINSRWAIRGLFPETAN